MHGHRRFKEWAVVVNFNDDGRRGLRGCLSTRRSQRVVGTRPYTRECFDP